MKNHDEAGRRRSRVAGYAAVFCALVLLGCTTVSAPTRKAYAPGIVSTHDSTEVKLTISPDGRVALWGVIGASDAPGGWQIFRADRRDGRWVNARPVAFNSTANDFDPSFAPDGRHVAFFSDREGGWGGDDIWIVAFDPETGRFGSPVNAGANVNTSGAEWAPSILANGDLLFSSDGHGGYGGQDLFVAPRKEETWTAPVNLGAALNSAQDDFDAALIQDDIIAFSRGNAAEGRARLYVTSWPPFGDPRELPNAINCSADTNNGPSFSGGAPGIFFWSAYCPAIGEGRMDIFSIDIDRLRLLAGLPRHPARPDEAH